MGVRSRSSEFVWAGVGSTVGVTVGTGFAGRSQSSIQDFFRPLSRPGKVRLGVSLPAQDWTVGSDVFRRTLSEQ